MNMYKRTMWVATVLCSFLLFACVTINIYFPAEKVESVAGEIVNDIRGRAEDVKEEQSKGQQDSFFKHSLNP